MTLGNLIQSEESLSGFCDECGSWQEKGKRTPIWVTKESLQMLCKICIGHIKYD